MTLHYGYADSTVTGDLELTCTDCHELFWWTAGEQKFYAEKGLIQPRRCQGCRRARKAQRDASAGQSPAEASSQALVPNSDLVRQAAEDVAANLPALKLQPGLRNKKSLYRDIEDLLNEATSPIVDRRRTFFEWLRGVDLKAEQMARKMAAANTADELVRQRTALLNHMRELIEAENEVMLSHIEAHIRMREAQLRAIKVEEEIGRHLALRDARLHTEALVEASKQVQLTAAIQPPEKPKTQAALVAQERDRIRTMARAKQSVVGDLLAEIERIYRRHIGRAEKAMRIRSVVEAYRQDVEDLPANIRAFLAQVDEVQGDD